MGLFDLFKKSKEIKQNAESHSIVSLNDFEFCYLYGLTDNPNRQSRDSENFNKLYDAIIGDIGGIIICNSFHPYQLVNQQGITVWHAAYIYLYANNNGIGLITSTIHDNSRYLVDLSESFRSLHIWPDIRLTHEENPVFGKYVPFIIPFLVPKSLKQTYWHMRLMEEIALNGHASKYVESITTKTSFIMPEPSFVLGFDNFDEENPSKMIDAFVSFKSHLGS